MKISMRLILAGHCPLSPVNIFKGPGPCLPFGHTEDLAWRTLAQYFSTLNMMISTTSYRYTYKATTTNYSTIQH